MATPTTATGRATPTVDATVTALSKEQLTLQVQQLQKQIQNQSNWLANNSTALIAAFATIIVALFGISQWAVSRRDDRRKEKEIQDKELEDRRAEREKRDEEQCHRTVLHTFLSISDTVGRLFSLTPQRLRRFANVLVWWLGNGPRAVSQPPHQRRMSEPRSGEEFPNGIISVYNWGRYKIV